VGGGLGNRFGGGVPKQFQLLGGRRVLDYSLDLFRSLDYLQGTVLVLPPDRLGEEKSRQTSAKRGSELRLASGGLSRQKSVQNGLNAIDVEADWVIVHDVARPLVTEDIVRRTLEGAKETGSAVCAIPVADTLKRSEDNRFVSKTVSREKLYSIQTPQAFSKKILEEALRWAEAKGLDETDEAGLLEKMGHRIKLIEGSVRNFKITQTQDLRLAEALLAQRISENGMREVRIGQGYDVHAFAEGRPLILGGVNIPFEKGLAGHSDADALLHAICDALLGAVAAGDLGAHFPDTDPQYQGISSLKLLEHCSRLVAEKGFAITNVDATLICQRPKLAPFIGPMRKNIARSLKVDLDRVSVKATTEEGLGFTGTMQGLAAKAVVLLQAGAHPVREGGTPS
jgi:2-C-methyl-D-erythritol 2,4-cyclodiphosphate synthase/2-C-methyl-D-erythritol 4-phosphate cytidylyltransferase